MDIPRLFKAGCPSDQTLERSGGAVRKEPRSAPYFVEVTNRPVCAERNGTIFLVAQPPRLGKAGNVHLRTFCAKPANRHKGTMNKGLEFAFAAYGLAFLVFFVFMWLTIARQNKLDRKLDELKSHLKDRL